MVKKDVHRRISKITARALSAKTKNYAKNKAPHVDRLLDPRPGLSLRSASQGQYQARLELVDQLNAEEVCVEIFKLPCLSRCLTIRTICVPQITLANPVEPCCRNVDLHVLRGMEGGTKGKPQAICVRNDGCTVLRIVHCRGLVTDTCTECPPIREAKVCTDRHKISVLPVVFDCFNAMRNWRNIQRIRFDVQRVKRRPIRPSERCIKAQ